LHEALSWLFVSDSFEETKKIVQKAVVQVAKQRGAKKVEVKMKNELD